MEDKPNPSQPTAMSPSKSGQNEGDPEQRTLETQTPIGESSDPPRGKNNEESEDEIHAGENLPEGEEEEDEEGECGFCLFMKAGGCREPFIEWEKCVEEGEKNKEDIVEKCFQVTAALKMCMEEHSDYYAPLLMAEKAAEADAMKELEMEKEKERDKVNEGNTESEKSEQKSEAMKESEMEKEKEESEKSEQESEEATKELEMEKEKEQEKVNEGNTESESSDKKEES